MNALAEPAEVRAHLVAAATAGTPLTYSELLAQLGYDFSRPKMRALCRVLASVDEDAAACGQPELAVLVVRQSDGLPGQGWWVAGGAQKHMHKGSWEGTQAKKLVKRLQGEAFRYWSNRAP